MLKFDIFDIKKRKIFNYLHIKSNPKNITQLPILQIIIEK